MAVHGSIINQADVYNSLGLAFMGDAVLALMIRRHLMKTSIRSVDELSREAAKFVCSKAQSEMYFALEPILSSEELDIMKRGRNAKSHSHPKNARVSDYRRATGLEALFGWIYLIGDTGRAEELFALCLNTMEEKI